MKERTLWVDKYCPSSSKDLVGNGKACEDFREWLKHWDEVVIQGRKRPIQPPRRGQSWQNVSNPNARAVMISGPPGIGKSSMVNIIAKEMGFGIMTINASDKRSKLVIENLLKQLCESNTINYFMEQVKLKKGQTNCLGRKEP